MISYFRKFFSSKLGLGLTLGFLALIAFAFASSDVANTGTFGGVAGGDRVAVVGDEKIGTAELSQSVTAALDRVRQQNPTLSMQGFVAQGGIDTVVEQLLDRYAIATYAQEHGLRAGDNLVNSEIRKIGAFRGADGNFSAETFRQALAQQGLTETSVRDDIRSGLLAQQVVIPGSFGASMPEKMAKRYAQLFKERRTGAIALLPSELYAPEGDPDEETLAAYYADNRDAFIRPERRIVRFASFNEEAVNDSIEPTEAEIAQRYEDDAALYAEREDRSFTQLIVPTQEAATALRDQVQAGASFSQVAQNAGLRVSDIGPVDRAGLADTASPEVAEAYFAAAQGSLAEPARSPLGWHIGQVNSVESRAGRALEQVRSEITEVIRDEKRVRVLADLAAQVEEQLDDGETLTSVAESLELEVTTTRAITADGLVYEGGGATAPQILAPALATIFQMEESEPQVADVGQAETYLIYEASEITESAAAPLADIRQVVVNRWKLSEGSKAAREAADRIMAAVSSGTAMNAAVAAEEKRLPPVDQISLTREELAQQAQQRIPPPLALLFSMAQGTNKRLAAANELGWFVVSLDAIEVGEIDADDPLIAQARQQLGPAVGEEYTRQLLVAMRETMGVETNPAAIEAVRKQLVGER
ncbi:SurA N-terminal domain-containing protein [Erythrobacter sp. W53]|uniref:peptidylprolyl isomerase n=1 Tax=Erythrobacter sp. W53 TaxID=3425947 RepID=UPI003D768315